MGRVLAVFNRICGLLWHVTNAPTMLARSYITRDFRLTPLVGRLTKKQLEWLADQRFMVGAYRLVDWQFHSDWWNTLCEGREQAERTMYEKVAFPGFREVSGLRGVWATSLG